MKIAFIGSGRMAQALTALFIEAGHEVMLTNSRGPASLDDLVTTFGPRSCAGRGDRGRPSGETSCSSPRRGRRPPRRCPSWTTGATSSCVDTTNNRSKPGPDGLIDIGDAVSSVLVASYVPGARVVKAFNATPIPFLVPALGANAGANNAIFIAGDDPVGEVTGHGPHRQHRGRSGRHRRPRNRWMVARDERSARRHPRDDLPRRRPESGGGSTLRHRCHQPIERTKEQQHGNRRAEQVRRAGR